MHVAPSGAGRKLTAVDRLEDPTEPVPQLTERVVVGPGHPRRCRPHDGKLPPTTVQTPTGAARPDCVRRTSAPADRGEARTTATQSPHARRRNAWTSTRWLPETFPSMSPTS